MVGIGCVRLVFLPLLGIAVVKCADLLALLPPADPLFRFVLLLQFAMPTAINLGKESPQSFGLIKFPWKDYSLVRSVPGSLC